MPFCAFFVFLLRLFLAYLTKYVLRRGVKEKTKNSSKIHYADFADRFMSINRFQAAQGSQEVQKREG